LGGVGLTGEWDAGLKGGNDSGPGTGKPIAKEETILRVFHFSVTSSAPRAGFVAGVAGPIGSGKSTLSRFLADLGAEVISGDRIGHEVLESEESVRRRLVERFGEDILDTDGAIDRETLAERAFRSESAHEALNEIVHPALVGRIRRRMEQHRRVGEGILVVDAALIPEWGMEGEMDVHVHVTAPRDVRQERWCDRGKSTREAFERRERCQLKEIQKRQNAGVVIHNDGGVKDLQDKAEILWDLLEKIRAGECRLTNRVEI
jgi:dephospho-CoA kinase